MESSGLPSERVRETYVAALQHGLDDLPEDTRRIGVVRGATPWLSAVVDENRPELGPPRHLLDETKDRQENLVDCGLDDVAAHNRAMVDVDYARRYRRYLATSSEAIATIDQLAARVRNGDVIALVCYENTEEKRCHRMLLREALLDAVRA